MGKLIDLTGKRFGSLLVNKLISKNDKGKYVWLCRCDCGNTKETFSSYLTSGNTTSCGCYQKKRANESTLIDLKGRKFGRLLVIKESGRDKDGRVMWECNCDCGRKATVRSNMLISKRTQSCGCYKKERLSQTSHVKDLTNQKFGRLTVVSLNCIYKGDAKWNCKCECGNKKVVFGFNLKLGTTVSCGCFAKEKTKEIHSDNLVGKVFGFLKVIKQDGTDKAHNTRWIVKCQKCGKESTALGVNLKNKNKRSCVCTKKVFKKPQYKDMVGQKFERLLVEKYYGSDKEGNALWVTSCDCGNTKIAAGYKLRAGRLNSCSCLALEKESFVASELKKYCVEKYNAKTEYKVVRNPDTNRYLPFDIFIKSKKIYVEVQGEQHYRFVKHWYESEEDFKYSRRLDRMKKKFAQKKGRYLPIDLRKVKTVKQAIEKLERFIITK